VRIPQPLRELCAGIKKVGPRRYAHSVGIILRDIKPRNLMIDAAASGVVKLTGSACQRSAAPKP